MKTLNTEDKTEMLNDNFFEYKNRVIKETQILTKFLKNMMREIESDLPTIKTCDKDICEDESNQIGFGFEDDDEMWTCWTCKYKFNNKLLKNCENCGRIKGYKK